MEVHLPYDPSLQDSIRIECPTEFRSRNERREKFRLGNEFAAQFFSPQALSTLNVRITDASGSSVLCHTEVFQNNVYLFPDYSDDRGHSIERPGGYHVYDPFATAQDFCEVLKFYYFDYLVLDRNFLTYEKLLRLTHAAYVLTQMHLYQRLLTITRQVEEQVTIRLNCVLDDDEEEDRDDEEERQRILDWADEVTASSFSELIGDYEI